jgi:hypothetical protein
MIRTGRRVLPGLALVAVLIAPTAALIQPAHGQTGCSAASLRGPYGIQASGMIFGVPTAYVGRYLFDGQGRATGSVTYNVGGVIDPIDGITGTYNVDESCSGSLVVHAVHHKPPSAHYHDFHLVVVDGGREALFETGGVKMSASDEPTAGVVLSGLLKRL